MVHAALPQGCIALHALIAYQYVLQGIVEGMAHMQRAGHIRRRYDNAVGLTAVGHIGLEISFFMPQAVPFLLNAVRVIGLIQKLVTHDAVLELNAEVPGEKLKQQYHAPC